MIVHSYVRDEDRVQDGRSLASLADIRRWTKRSATARSVEPLFSRDRERPNLELPDAAFSRVHREEHGTTRPAFLSISGRSALYSQNHSARRANPAAGLTFILVTIWINVMSCGESLPVYPRLIQNFARGDVGQAAPIVGALTRRPPNVTRAQPDRCDPGNADPPRPAAR